MPLNCAALPEHLLESEMFGHRKGSFTGADREKVGLLEMANGGTFFLDELTEMPMPLQAKLLRVVQDGVLRRVGSEQQDAVVDVRFISATNRDPGEAIGDGICAKTSTSASTSFGSRFRRYAIVSRTSRFSRRTFSNVSGCAIIPRRMTCRNSATQPWTS